MIKNKLKYLKFYLQYKNKIYSYFWYRTGGMKELAEDLTQEVFLKGWKEFHSFLEDRPFQAWIYKIAKNHLIDYYRAHKEEIDIETFQFSSKESKYLELQQLLEQLPEKKREILILKYLFGYNYKEIGEITSQSEGAARVTAHRALKQLRKKNA